MKEIKTEWDLGVMYKSPDDPQLEADMAAIETAAKNFREKCYGKESEFLKDESTILEALIDYEKLCEILITDLPGYYLERLFDLETDNGKVEALKVSFGKRYTTADNSIEFFTLSIGKVSLAKQEEFLQSKILDRYHYLLRTIFDSAAYALSEKEEELISELKSPGFDMWTMNTENLLGEMSISCKGEIVPVHEAVELLKKYIPTKDRRMIDKKVIKKLKTISSTAASEMSAIITFGKIEDRKRGMSHAYTDRFLEDEMDEETALGLVDLTTSMFSISHRFYALHAKLLGEKKLKMCDMLTPVGEGTKFTFEKSIEIVHSALSSVDPQYGSILMSYLKQGRIDAFSRKGKTGGGYCASGGDAPVFILFNHVENLFSLGTVGHEMGHAIHAELSRSQPAFYKDCSLAAAETASTFFEQVTLERALEMIPLGEKLILSHYQVQNDMYCIFFQVALFNFEVELHERVAAEGKLSDVEMARLMQKHLAAMFGSAVEVTEDDGYFFVRRSHIRDFFYHYTYAYGQLISKVMFTQWKKDKTFADKVKQFLSAGGSDSPYNIFKNIGIDTRDPEFFKSGLMEVSKSIDELEALARNAGKIK